MRAGTSGRAGGLDWLLHPVPRSDFLGRFWEVEPLLVDRCDRAYFGELPGLDAVEELISATSAAGVRSPADVRLVRSEPNGSLTQRGLAVNAQGAPDLQDAYRRYHESYTIVVNQMHRRSTAVAQLCRALETDLHHEVGANLYLTPRDAQGFRPHVDTHDVFVLQLHGSKEWHVGEATGALPLPTTEPANPASLADFQKFLLEPGDLLYLPRGVPHEALTSTTSSLHLTVGVYVATWTDLLTEALSELAGGRLDLRRALPAGFLDAPLDHERAAALADGLATALRDGALAERARARLGKRLMDASKVAGAGHFRSLDALADLDGGSVVERAQGLLCTVRTTSDEAVIEFPYNFVSGPSRLGPALRFIAAHPRFAVDELPGDLSPDDRIDLVVRLVSEGLLVNVDNGPTTTGGANP